MMEKHTKYYCGYKNIKKIYLCNHNQETEGKIICWVSSQVNLRTEMSGTVPPKGSVGACQAVCNPLQLSVYHPHLQRWVAQRHPDSPIYREAAQRDRLWTPKARARMKGFYSPKKRRTVLWPRKQVAIDLHDQWQSHTSTHFSVLCSVTLMSAPTQLSCNWQTGKSAFCLRFWTVPSFLNKWRVLS